MADQWHPTLNGELTPELVTPHSRKVVWWLCPRGHATQDTVDSRTKGMVCQACPNSRRNKKRDLKPTDHIDELFPPLEQ
ncbi:zinc-ribbon domain-containing protein [Citricoccus nitrophenolicus]|uniref:zinc-ribbon domain-containing protein n=1 Tax=Citricoccus nitrophenolicus TaxID=863575 RepID=UPI0039B68EEF